ncbi:origin recognition complex subunit 4 [Sporothrix curviconia]|uniref:Origin recognition complex subunit 4 n=1 Tax=Sporothrix curviconia TaxID=1260050 RepID=A0ABP0C7X5_9PEZI
MLGGVGRKRARSEDGDENGVTDENVHIGGGGVGAGMVGTIKRQKLASTVIPTSTSTSVLGRDLGASDDAALFPGPDIARITPKTPRTVQAMASAISGAFTYGERLLPRPFTSLLNERNNARTSLREDLDKIYDFPGNDSTEGNGDDEIVDVAAAAAATTPTTTTPQMVPGSDVEEHTLVGSASPTPDTPSKRQPTSAAKPATESATKSSATSAAKTTTPGGGDKKKKRRDVLEDLTIDGTDKLKNGLEGSLPRASRIRNTPKRYLDDGGDASIANNAGRGTRPRANSSATNGVAPATGSAEVAVIEASPVPAASSVDNEEAAAPSTTRKRSRSAVSTNTSAAAKTPKTPMKAPSSARKRAGSKVAAPDANGSMGTPASARRARATPATATEKPTPKRARGKTALHKDASKETAPTESQSKQATATMAAPATMTAEPVPDVVDDDSDGDVCAVCSKPDSEPPNEIVFCETCDLAVHQQCYNIPVIPEGDWFCKNCVRRQQQQRAPVRDNLAKAKEAAAQGASAAEATTEDEEQTALAELAAAAKAARDLAPDIANFEHHLSKMKRVLLGRCTGRHRVRLQGQDEAYNKVHQVVKQTVVAGEGNSMMVIGARGTGKTTMVESILGDLAADHGGAFHVVRLNGFIHTDDKLALREIWRQLGKEMAVEDDVVNKTNNYADTLASLLALLSHPSEIQAATIGTGGGGAEKDGEGGAAVPAVTSTAVVFIIDEFDLFATHARQTLLYNLFDIAQARKAPIAVLGLTTKIDVVESLEKRVKSRFSHRYVYLPLARSLPAFWDICRLGLDVDDENDNDGNSDNKKDKEADAMDVDEMEGHAEFLQWWKHMIDTAKDDGHFQDQLVFHYYSSKSVPAFWTTCLMPLAAVSSAAPRLRLPPVGEGALGGNLGAPSEGGVRRGVGRPPRSAGESAASAKSLGDVDTLPLAPPDSKLHLLAALSELELSLLISAARLDIVLSTDTVNFAMAYDEYVSLMSRQRVQASLAGSGLGVGTGAIHTPSGRGVGRPPGGSTTVVGGGARVWGRGVASRAWERLAALGLLIPAGLGASSRGRGRGSSAQVTSGLEGRSMWRTEVALEEIATAPGVRVGAVLGRWCKEI